MVDIEDLTEAELDVLHKFYQKLSDKAQGDDEIHLSHSIGNAEELQKEKSLRLKQDAL